MDKFLKKSCNNILNSCSLSLYLYIDSSRLSFINSIKLSLSAELVFILIELLNFRKTWLAGKHYYSVHALDLKSTIPIGSLQIILNLLIYSSYFKENSSLLWFPQLDLCLYWLIWLLSNGMFVRCVLNKPHFSK